MAENKLKEALLLALEEEIIEAEEEMRNAPAHTFSKRHEKKIGKIIRDAEVIRDENRTDRRYRRVKPRRVAAIIVAAILFIAAASVAVAVVKPQIYYTIKEKLISWDITFSSNQEEPLEPFEYIKPEVPEGFEVVDETKMESIYIIDYRGNNGETISYEQMLPEEGVTSIDNEHSNTRHELIDDREIIVSETDSSTIIIFENGEYVFSVDGTCDKSILYDIAREIILDHGR